MHFWNSISRIESEIIKNNHLIPEMPGKITKKARDRAQTAPDTVGNPLVFTTTTTTTTTKHITLDKDTVDFEQIKRLLSNGNSPAPIMDSTAANDTSQPRQTKQRSLTQDPIRYPRARRFNVPKRSSVWMVSDENRTNDDVLRSASLFRPIMIKVEPGLESHVFASNETSVNASHAGSHRGKLSISQVNHFDVAPFHPILEVTQPTIQNTMTSTGAVPKQRSENTGKIDIFRNIHKHNRYTGIHTFSISLCSCQHYENFCSFEC